jgi:hypothetical protein
MSFSDKLENLVDSGAFLYLPSPESLTWNQMWILMYALSSLSFDGVDFLFVSFVKVELPIWFAFI